MTITDMAFNPATGLLDTTTYPTEPADETAARTQIQGRLNEIRDWLNDTLLVALAAVTDSASGADNIGMTPITETGASATVQSIIEALIARLKSAELDKSGADLIGLTTITGITGNTLQTFLSNLVARLKSIDYGASGADLIGLTSVTDISANNVQAFAEELVTRLKATTDSASGADLIGATAISGLTGGTVQALLEALDSALDTHKADTAPHSATSAATASRLLVRDSAGRAKVATPSAEDDIALLSNITWRQGGDLSGAINYDSLTPNRTYNVTTRSGATNPPPEDYGILEYYATSQYQFQRYTQVTGPKVYIRGYGASWSAWTQL